MRVKLMLLLGLLLAGVVGAIDRSPESGQTSVLNATWGFVYCSPDCKYAMPGGDRVNIATRQGTVRVARSGEWTIVQFPGHTARVRESLDGSEVLVQFKNRNYRLLRKPRELQVVLPDDTITYTLSSGAVKSILGQQGQVQVKRNTPKHTFALESNAGTSSFLVKSATLPGKKKEHELSLGLLDGIAADQHPYIYRALRFEDAGVGICVPLRVGPLFTALPWKNTLVIGGPVASAPPAEGGAPQVIQGQAPPSRQNPLQADPADPQGTPLKATTNTTGDPLKADTGKPGETRLKADGGKPEEDPLKLKSKGPGIQAPGSDPLKANEIPQGVDKLKVQENQ